MSCTIKPRWWHWLFGVALPLFTVGFELGTHQMSGTIFDPMTTPMHAVLMIALPFGVLMTSSSRGQGLAGRLGGVLVGFGLPYGLLLVIAIGPSHLSALFKFAIGLISLCAQSSAWLGTLFGDYGVSPVAAVAYFGPVFALLIGGRLWLRSLVSETVRRASSASLLLSLAGGLVIAVYLEAQAVRWERVIRQALADMRNDNAAANRELQMSPLAKHTIARLSHPGQQFSSAGTLYAVGPVDVFGPWNALASGSPQPVDTIRKYPAAKAAKLHQTLWPGESIRPSCWRGLSPWEKY